MKILQNGLYKTHLEQFCWYCIQKVKLNAIFKLFYYFTFLHVIKMISFKMIHYFPLTSYPSLCCNKGTSINVQFCSLLILTPLFYLIEWSRGGESTNMCTFNCQCNEYIDIEYLVDYINLEKWTVFLLYILIKFISWQYSNICDVYNVVILHEEYLK